VPYGSKLHIPPTNYDLLAVQQEPHKKSLTSNEKCPRIFRKKKAGESPLAETL